MAKRERRRRPAAGIEGPAHASGQGLWDYLRIFVRHRWWAAAGFLLLAAPMVALTLLTTPIFGATTRVLVADGGDRRVGLGTAEGGAPTPALDLYTQSEVVRGRALGRRVVETLKLWEAPEFARMVATVDGAEARAQALVDPLLGRLSVAVITDSRLIEIGAEAEDPALAARIANAAANQYIERDRESRFAAAREAAEWLSNQLADQRRQVSTTETALQAYRANQDALSLSDRQNIVGQKLADLNGAVTKAKTDRIQREAQYQQIQALKANPAGLESHPLVAANAFVQTLKAQLSELTRQDAQISEQLGPKHPDRIQVTTALESVQARLRAEINKVVAGIEADYEAAVSQESSLNAALSSQKVEAFALDRKGVEYAALEREAVSARQVFDALLQQTKEAALTSEIQQSPLRVIDAAEPPTVPVRPRRNQGLAAAATLGVLGALGGAFSREFLRRRIHTPADIEQRLGLPVLALVPMAEGDGDQIGNLPALPAEAFRRLRASIMLTCDDDTPGNVLVVSSAAPGEGKSFVSAHLAAALAAADQRVVLIDADMRRPRLHTMFDRKRAPGLSDVLLGRRSTSEILKPVGMQGLVLVPSGMPTTQASELVSMDSFHTFIEGLRTDFDWIIIDSPPVMAVADASVLAREALGVLFVTTAEQTSIESAEQAIAEFETNGATFVGAVLNRAPLAREAFYYSRYYRTEYQDYMSPERATVEVSSEPSLRRS